jgi:hypothetical protein
MEIAMHTYEKMMAAGRLMSVHGSTLHEAVTQRIKCTDTDLIPQCREEIKRAASEFKANGNKVALNVLQNAVRKATGQKETVEFSQTKDAQGNVVHVAKFAKPKPRKTGKVLTKDMHNSDAILKKAEEFYRAGNVEGIESMVDALEETVSKLALLLEEEEADEAQTVPMAANG